MHCFQPSTARLLSHKQDTRSLPAPVPSSWACTRVPRSQIALLPAVLSKAGEPRASHSPRISPFSKQLNTHQLCPISRAHPPATPREPHISSFRLHSHATDHLENLPVTPCRQAQQAQAESELHLDAGSVLKFHAKEYRPRLPASLRLRPQPGRHRLIPGSHRRCQQGPRGLSACQQACRRVTRRLRPGHQQLRGAQQARQLPRPKPRAPPSS